MFYGRVSQPWHFLALCGMGQVVLETLLNSSLKLTGAIYWQQTENGRSPTHMLGTDGPLLSAQDSNRRVFDHYLGVSMLRDVVQQDLKTTISIKKKVRRLNSVSIIKTSHHGLEPSSRVRGELFSSSIWEQFSLTWSIR